MHYLYRITQVLYVVKEDLTHFNAFKRGFTKAGVFTCKTLTFFSTVWLSCSNRNVNLLKPVIF